MKKKPRFLNKRRKGLDDFSPSREDLEKAIVEYFFRGGKITRVEIREEDYEKFMSLTSDVNIMDF